MNIPFNKPYMTGRELWLISQAHAKGHLSGDGAFTKQCHEWLERDTAAARRCSRIRAPPRSRWRRCCSTCSRATK